MEKAELIAFLKDEMSIRVQEHHAASGWGSWISVELWIGDMKVSSDTIPRCCNGD